MRLHRAVNATARKRSWAVTAEKGVGGQKGRIRRMIHGGLDCVTRPKEGHIELDDRLLRVSWTRSGSPVNNFENKGACTVIHAVTRLTPQCVVVV